MPTRDDLNAMLPKLEEFHARFGAPEQLFSVQALMTWPSGGAYLPPQ